MKKAVVFAFEALLVLLASASLIYFAHAPATHNSLAPWRAKLLAEDVVHAFAEKATYAGNLDDGALLQEVLAHSERLGNCVTIYYRENEGSTGSEAACRAGNVVYAHRTIFDGEGFFEVSVRVDYG